MYKETKEVLVLTIAEASIIFGAVIMGHLLVNNFVGLKYINYWGFGFLMVLLGVALRLISNFLFHPQ